MKHHIGNTGHRKNLWWDNKTRDIKDVGNFCLMYRVITTKHTPYGRIKLAREELMGSTNYYVYAFNRHDKLTVYARFSNEGDAIRMIKNLRI